MASGSGSVTTAGGGRQRYGWAGCGRCRVGWIHPRGIEARPRLRARNALGRGSGNPGPNGGWPGGGVVTRAIVPYESVRSSKRFRSTPTVSRIFGTLATSRSHARSCGSGPAGAQHLAEWGDQAAAHAGRSPRRQLRTGIVARRRRRNTRSPQRGARARSVHCSSLPGTRTPRRAHGDHRGAPVGQPAVEVGERMS